MEHPNIFKENFAIIVLMGKIRREIPANAAVSKQYAVLILTHIG